MVLGGTNNNTVLILILSISNTPCAYGRPQTNKQKKTMYVLFTPLFQQEIDLCLCIACFVPDTTVAL